MKPMLVIVAVLLAAACNQQSSSAKQTGVKDSITANTGAANDSIIITAGTVSASINNNDATFNNTFQANKLIVAGKSIGNILIGMDDSKLEMFGKPDMSDAAMGKAWLTWYGKKPDEHNNKTQLNVYTAYKDTGMRSKTVQQIRTTSSFFKTANGIHIYSALNDIEKNFKNIKKLATYTNNDTTINIYDAPQQGIAFEVAAAKQICTGIIIHKPGIKVTQVYISLHPNMHVL